MPRFKCPYPECTTYTEDVTEALAATMLTIHASGAHPPIGATATPPAPPQHKEDKVKRPTITLAGTTYDWTYFTTRWEEYKSATGITGNRLVLQLLECCDDELRKDLTRTAGGSLANKPEDDVLKAIKRLAIREENTMVARIELNSMNQDHGEAIRSFESRIRGQAHICNFTVQCPNADCNHTVSYMNEMLRPVFVRGISDPDIRLQVCQDVNQNMTLEEIVSFVEKKEAGKRSANRLQSVEGVSSVRSQYRNSKKNFARHQGTNDSDITLPCLYCGTVGHGSRAAPPVRMKKCPAYGKTCNYCKKLHHTAGQCRVKSLEKQTSSTDSVQIQEDSTICSIHVDAVTRRTTLTINHHTYDDLNKTWRQQHSKAQPFITISISIGYEDYKNLDIPPPQIAGAPSTMCTQALADTGCQSCLVGFTIVMKLGLKKTDLMSVSMTMQAANSNGIPIIGAVFLIFSGRARDGTIFESRQMTYVTNDSTKLFLSQEACMNLGLITSNFPLIGEFSPVSNINECIDTFFRVR